MSAAPSDAELARVLRSHLDGREITALSRKPYRYATSAPLEALQVSLADGGILQLIFKDLDRERLLDDARASKPDFLHEPLREIETYRRILAPNGVGPECFAAISEDDPPRHWLIVEWVQGVELWQVGELEVWERVASWLARFHAGFADRVGELRSANPHLLELGDAWFRSWCERARSALAESSDTRAPALAQALERYDELIAPLARLPHTFVHGELYPSNVLVEPGRRPLRVCPVDWEMAGIGTGLIDLAALAGGWGPEEQGRLAAAYTKALRDFGPSSVDARPDAADLARCRLHLALQWLGWSGDWRPPPEHAHDWIGEALGLTKELGLLEGGGRR